jgi:3-deoxy-D-manno-octulosonic-acid transferase
LRPGEETPWLDAAENALRSGSLNLIVAPRHKEKFDFFAEALSRRRIEFERLSELRRQGRSQSAASCLLVDTFGDLAGLYGGALAAFVGGTLVDIGGHNPLEPAARGVVPVVGAFTKNISEVLDDLTGADAVVRIAQPDDLQRLMKRVLASDPDLRAAGERARQVSLSYRGAAGKVVADLERHGVLR